MVNPGDRSWTRRLGRRPVAAVAWGGVGEPGIYLKQLELGPMQNFVYLIGDPVARECVAVDPAWEIDTIVDTAASDGMRLTGALVTHTHQDHVGGSLASWGMPGRIPGVEELNIGHSIVSRAVLVGMERAVREMKEAIQGN